MLDSYTIAIIIFVTLLLLLTGVKIWYAYNSKSSFIDKNDTELIEKLQKCGWKLISKKGCVFCDKQLELVNYPHIDISDVRPDVISVVKGVPLWVNTIKGIEIAGLQSKEQLLALTHLCQM